MMQTLKLLIPALIPSWNFFDVIADSPRIEYAVLNAPGDEGAWREFRPRPHHLPISAMLGRLFWNARWNETLFVVSCAERLLAEPTAHSEKEIFQRIAADIADLPEASWLRFRIALLSEIDGVIVREIAFISDPRAVKAIS